MTDEGGDPACWLPAVCGECGRIHDEPASAGEGRSPWIAGSGLDSLKVDREDVVIDDLGPKRCRD